MHTTPLILTLLATTVAVPIGSSLRAQDDTGSAIRVEAGRKLPKKLASFGAAQIGNWLYVYGGHSGHTHQFGSHTQSGDFFRVSLLENAPDDAVVEQLPADFAVQGTALVAHGDSLYRIGGLHALNGPGEPDELVSTDTVGRFDVSTGRWSEATRLPEPRSSHDAWVIGDRVFVVGGWSMGHDASGEPLWHQTAWSADLTQDPIAWEPLPEPPFRRRALAVAALGDKLAVVGGIEPDRSLSSATALFDPVTGEWSEGPELPARGFGAAAITVDSVLYASGMNSPLFALRDGDESYTEVCDYATPRFFERFAVRPDGDLLAVAGVGAGDHLSTIEVLPLRASKGPRITTWSLPYDGEARNRQGMFMFRDAVWFFGGNKTTEQHAFDVEDFSSQGRCLRLATMTVDDAMPAAPLERQSYSTIQTGQGSVDGWALGGFGHAAVGADGSIEPAGDDTVERAHPDLWHFDLKYRTWKHVARMPEARTQFGLCEHDGALWVFGGTDFDPRREEEFAYPASVLRYRLDGDDGFETTPFELPQPRRAFGSARLGDEFFLVGGMREDFRLVESVDVFDFRSGTFRQIEAPSAPRISPVVVATAGRLVMALGSSPTDAGGFAENRSVEVYEPGIGWRTVIDELPFPTRHTRMFERNGQLVFVSTQFEDGGRLFLAQVDLGLRDRPPVGIDEASVRGDGAPR